MHTADCQHAQAVYAVFAAAHPKICTICHGSGLIYSPGDFVPYGSTSAQLPGNEDSCSCVEDGHCPRCAEPVGLMNTPNDPLNRLHAYADLYYFCAACGWDELHSYDNDSDWLYPPECLCYEKEQDRADSLGG